MALAQKLRQSLSGPAPLLAPEARSSWGHCWGLVSHSVPAGGEARDKQPKSRPQGPSRAASLAVPDDSVLDDRAELALRRPEFYVTKACF